MQAAARWDIALSFAGEQREYVRQVAARLGERGLRVFYDAHEEPNLYGRPLRRSLQDVYGVESRVVIVFVSAEYGRSEYCRHELDVINERKFSQGDTFLLLWARFDDTRVDGLFGTMAYKDLRGVDAGAYADLVIATMDARGVLPPTAPASLRTRAVVLAAPDDVEWARWAAVSAQEAGWPAIAVPWGGSDDAQWKRVVSQLDGEPDLGVVLILSEGSGELVADRDLRRLAGDARRPRTAVTVDHYGVVPRWWSGRSLDLSRGNRQQAHQALLTHLGLDPHGFPASDWVRFPRELDSDVIDPAVDNLLPSDLDAVLGFDLGDGDTVVARSHPSGSGATVLPIDLRRESTMTVVGRREGATLVGRRALQAADVRDVDVNFKGRFEAGSAAEQSLVEFVRAVRESMVEHYALKSGRTLVMLGHPAAWAKGSARHSAYLKAFERGFAPGAVRAVPESRAVLFALRDEGLLRSSDLMGDVLVVDIGSSTTDFTLVRNLVAREVIPAATTSLGAAHIDRMVLRDFLDRPENAGFARTADQTMISRVLISIRDVKEDLFDYEPHLLSQTGGDDVRLPLRDSPQAARAAALPPWSVSTEDLRLAITRASAELDGMSWLDRFRSDLDHALRQVDTEGLVVCLTGGGARMGFVADVIHERSGVWPLRPEPPHLAVARGLALAGQTMVRAQNFLQATERLVRSEEFDALVERHMPKYAEAVAGWAAAGITERLIIPAYEEWQRADSGTLASVPGRIDDRALQWASSDEALASLAAALTDWSSHIERDLDDLTRPLLDEYAMAAGVLSVPMQPVTQALLGIGTDTDRIAMDRLIGGTTKFTVAGIGYSMALYGYLLNGITTFSGLAIGLGPWFGLVAVMLAGVGMVAGSSSARDRVEKWLVQRELSGKAKSAITARTVTQLRDRAAELDKQIHESIVAAITDEGEAGEEFRRALGSLIVDGSPADPLSGLRSTLRQRAAQVTILLP
jgi:hypothetical protein